MPMANLAMISDAKLISRGTSYLPEIFRLVGYSTRPFCPTRINTVGKGACWPVMYKLGYP
jgi:hypothetical protein